MPSRLCRCSGILPVLASHDGEPRGPRGARGPLRSIGVDARRVQVARSPLCCLRALPEGGAVSGPWSPTKVGTPRCIPRPPAWSLTGYRRVKLRKEETREPIRSSSIQGGHSALVDRGRPERHPLNSHPWLTPGTALRRIGVRHTNSGRTTGHSRPESNTSLHPTPI